MTDAPFDLPQQPRPIWQLVTALVIGAGAMAFGGFWLGRLSAPIPFSESMSVAPPVSSPVPQSVGTPPSPTPLPLSGKRLYFQPTATSEGTTFFDQELPAEITQMPDTKLKTISCSPFYSKQIDGSYTMIDPVGGDLVTVENETVFKIADLINEATKDRDPDEFAFCQTDNAQKLVIYNIFQGGGGGANTVNLTLTGKDDQVLGPITTIPNSQGFPYFNCRYPLQLTTDNVVYLQCGGGDGGFVGGLLMKVNLISTTQTTLKTCRSSWRDPEDSIENIGNFARDLTCESFSQSR